MITRSQRYASVIFDQVSNVPEDERQKYGSMAHKLPVLIRTAGLAQSLAFVQSRGSEKLLDHISAVVAAPDLLERSRTAALGDYIRLTRNVMSALEWYKRFAQSVLHIDPGDTAEEVTADE